MIERSKPSAESDSRTGETPLRSDDAERGGLKPAEVLLERETGESPLAADTRSIVDQIFGEDGHAKNLPDLLPLDGSDVCFHENGRAWLSASGSITVEVKLGEPVDRKGFERLLDPPGKLGLEGYDRSHPTGAGGGVESPYGILYTPTEVNREHLNRELEHLQRQLLRHRRDDVDLYARVELLTDESGFLMKEGNYEIHARLRSEGDPETLREQHGAGIGNRERLFAASIEIDGQPGEPSVVASVTNAELSNGADWERFLKPTDRGGAK